MSLAGPYSVFVSLIGINPVQTKRQTVKYEQESKRGGGPPN